MTLQTLPRKPIQNNKSITATLKDRTNDSAVFYFVKKAAALVLLRLFNENIEYNQFSKIKRIWYLIVKKRSIVHFFEKKVRCKLILKQS